MTQKQWDTHRQHVDDHITWPATKQEIVDACQGMDVEPAVLKDLKTMIPDGPKKYTKSELHDQVVS
ncbi:MAG: hypothetical protein UX91_C0003G0057 [Candidatus Amesbacteria bacterium GW2011_GWB1_47_19]|nr:MAG: hypothetical protein UW51_C0003G0063 [Candidatus Amesbacteria bacterium GW2011_GWA1_44_24]KKU31488.1 MAG: hypothetical protein UX46_C0005G0057 [Candidatus Amesbacteria bacterium GW2011_GWC1_46_24]KKU67496.1 MAG: hypothetical protein UX91_C0003G0057 [Candidatus Amesbacteria bacterium GW2011_GWB1_47_19]